MRLCVWLITLSALLMCASPVRAQQALVRSDQPHTSVEIFAETTGRAQESALWLAVRFTPQDGWHTYWENFGDTGKEPAFDWTLPEGWTIEPPLYPIPHAIPIGPLVNYGYEEPATLLFRVRSSTAGRTIDTAPVAVEMAWLVCEEICVPEAATLNFTVGKANQTPALSALFEQARSALPHAAPWTASAWQDDQTIALEIDMPAEEAALVADAYFFPRPDGLIAYSAAQKLMRGENGLTLYAQRPNMPEAYDHLSGVLVIENASGQREGFELETGIEATGSITVPETGFAGQNTILPLAIGVWEALLFAVIGGIILNLMPCVFPVLFLKAFSLIKSRDAGQGVLYRDALAYLAGILATFLLIGGALLGARAAGAAIGWGFQLQSPVILGLLATLFFVLGLNLIGFFEVSSRFAGIGQGLSDKKGAIGTFFTGALVVVVATPCTAPFMAAALGFAIVQPVSVALTVFLGLGLGLALPYLAFAFVPALRTILPRPGNWMSVLRQLLAFPIFLTAIWLLWVLGRQAGIDSVVAMLAAFLVIGFSIWIWRHLSLEGHVRGVTAVGLMALNLFVLGLILSQTHSAEMVDGGVEGTNGPQFEIALGIETWSEQRLREVRAEGRPAFVYFTADWCITCKVNERLALANPQIAAYVKAHNIAVLKADWTNQNARIAKELEKFGRSGVPLYLYYAANSVNPIILPQILTPSGLLSALSAS